MSTKLNLNGQNITIDGPAASAPDSPATAMPVPVELVRPNPHQPRRDFDEAKLKELAASIKTHGLIQPITVEPVYPDNGNAEITYILHDGERRLRASKLAGLEMIPAYIVNPGADAQALLIRAVVANLQRDDLNPIELAQSYQQLSDQGLTDQQIADQVGKSRSTVANARRLLNLPDDRQQQVAAGELSERQATGLPVIDAATKYDYNQKEAFYGQTGAQTLQIALKQNCPNLHLQFYLEDWQSGPGPKDIPNCKYVCLHHGKECACAKIGRAAHDKEDEERKKETKRIKTAAYDHLCRVATDNQAIFLRAILHTTTRTWNNADDKVLDLPPDKVSFRLARWLLQQNADPSTWRSPAENVQYVNDWLKKVGLPLLDNAQSPIVQDLDRRLIKIGEWVKGCRKTIPTPKQVAGNLTNIAQLAEEALQFRDTGDQARTQLADAKIFAGIDQLKTALLSLQPLVETHHAVISGHPGDIEIEHVSWLLTVPAGDINFKGHLTQINHLATLNYALALGDLFGLSRTARQSIGRRWDKLNKDNPVGVQTNKEI